MKFQHICGLLKCTCANIYFGDWDVKYLMKGAQLRATVVGGQTKSVEHYKTLFSVISSY